MTEDERKNVGKGLVQKATSVFTKEALQSQDGKKVPLRLENDGPVIGEATLTFDEGENALMAEFRVDDPHVAEFLKQTPPSYIFKEPDGGR